MDLGHKIKRQLFYPPGGILIWMIIGVELATFAGAFIFFFIERADQLEQFKLSQRFLNVLYGVMIYDRSMSQ